MAHWEILVGGKVQKCTCPSAGRLAEWKDGQGRIIDNNLFPLGSAADSKWKPWKLHEFAAFIRGLLVSH